MASPKLQLFFICRALLMECRALSAEKPVQRERVREREREEMRKRQRNAKRKRKRKRK